MLTALVILSTILGVWILFSIFVMGTTIISLNMQRDSLDSNRESMQLQGKSMDLIIMRIKLLEKKLDSFKDEEGDWWKQRP